MKRSTAKLIIVLAAVLILALLASAAHGKQEGMLAAKVTRVVDGDTIVVSFDGRTERVRLIGVDTPESVHPDQGRNVPYGKVASEFTKSRLEGKEVFLEFDVAERDKYGRLLAYVYIDGAMFNKTLLDEGHAMVATYPPNVKYVDVFTAAQKAARKAGKGLWGIGEPGDLEVPKSPGGGDSGGNAGDGAVTAEYIGTAKSMKFHTMTCESGQTIAARNAVYFESREEAVAAGFAPCKACNP